MDGTEVDGDAAEPEEGSKKKKKKGVVKEEVAKEKGIILVMNRHII